MRKTKLSAILLVMAVVLVMSACSNNKQLDNQSNEETKSKVVAEESEEKTFTLEELAKYDGQNGNPAYVAVDGVVYDVTSIGAWKDGKHNGLTAGKDLTEEIKTMSPHGVSKLSKLDVVGKIVESE